MTQCQSASLKIAMVSGHFDVVHQGHLSYLEQAGKCGDFIVCVVSADHQVIKKKGKVSIPEQHRARMVDLILSGLQIPHKTVINIWDKDTTLVAEAIRSLRPDIFCRGGDKVLADMPLEERQACEECGIRIVHGTLEHDIHGSTIRGDKA